jgi:oligosaccharide repeat unit polymerase
MIIARVGVTAPFQNGHTFLLFLEGFVPRILWPDKPDSSIGQLFNRELRITESRENYVSTTVLGELYWNFGWLGIIVGCPLFGSLLGIINRRCDLSQRISVARFLIFCITTYGFCLRFEDGFAMTSTIWIRTLIAIGVLHMLFARNQRVTAVSVSRADQPATENHGDPAAAMPFPHLLR